MAAVHHFISGQGETFDLSSPGTSTASLSI